MREVLARRAVIDHSQRDSNGRFIAELHREYGIAGQKN